MKLRMIGVLAAALTLSACETSTGGAAGTSGAQAAASTAPITASRAMTVFEGVCGASLPDFSQAEARMTQFGVVSKAATGTVYSRSEDLSMKLIDGPGAGKTCSLVFGTKENVPTALSAITKLGSFRATPLGNAAKYKNTEALIILSDKTSELGDVTYFNIRMLSER